MPNCAKKFRSKHHFGCSRKKGKCRKGNRAAAAWEERALTSPDNAIVNYDASPSVRGVDLGHVSRVSTDINRGACEMASPDNVHLVNCDRVNTIDNRRCNAITRDARG
ncbi:hypothetical protein HPB50_007480 [Hyalomma asiaticum]|uniref:Uncharacterized protein n=1 Tax=Hyalomma asiaticum TaxID=266040 RepID=A0ACB7SRB1_HYAAI|nr:hypothetical protein HPB50_007480 [Hyalomma asiaticum]